MVQECRGKAADAAAGKAQADDDSSGHKQPTTQPALCLGLHSATQPNTTAAGHGQNSRCRLRLFHHHITCVDACHRGPQLWHGLMQPLLAVVASHSQVWVILTSRSCTGPNQHHPRLRPCQTAGRSTPQRGAGEPPPGSNGWQRAQSRCAGQCVSQTRALVRQAPRCCG